MACFSTRTAPARRNPTGKNRAWDFFRYLTNRTRQTAASPCNRKFCIHFFPLTFIKDKIE